MLQATCHLGPPVQSITVQMVPNASPKQMFPNSEVHMCKHRDHRRHRRHRHLLFHDFKTASKVSPCPPTASSCRRCPIRKTANSSKPRARLPRKAQSQLLPTNIFGCTFHLQGLCTSLCASTLARRCAPDHLLHPSLPGI